jgi:hypothetical protein
MPLLAQTTYDRQEKAAERMTQSVQKQIESVRRQLRLAVPQAETPDFFINPFPPLPAAAAPELPTPEQYLVNVLGRLGWLL